MGWDDAEKQLEKKGGSFISLKDGEAIELVFRGSPYTFYQAYKDENEYSSWAEGRSFRFRINVAILEEGKWVSKLFQQGTKTLRSLVEAKKEYGLDNVFKLKRVGSTKDDTAYHILFKSPLAPSQLNDINALKELPLTRGKSRNDIAPQEAQAKAPVDATESDIPF